MKDITAFIDFSIADEKRRKLEGILSDYPLKTLQDLEKGIERDYLPMKIKIIGSNFPKEDIDIFFMRYDKNTNYKKIKEKYPKTNVIVPYFVNEIKSITKNIQGIKIANLSNPNGIYNILDDLRREKKLYKKINISLIGSGFFIQGILRELKQGMQNGFNWVNQIYWYSERLSQNKNGYEDLILNLGLAELNILGKVQTFNNLEDWGAEGAPKSDFIIFATANKKRTVKSFEYINRVNSPDEENSFLYTTAIPKLNRVCKASQDKDSTWIVGSNPIGPLLLYMYYKYGKKGICPTPDLKRAQILSCYFLNDFCCRSSMMDLKNLIKPHLEAQNIKLNIFGEHHDPLIDFQHCFFEHPSLSLDLKELLGNKFNRFKKYVSIGLQNRGLQTMLNALNQGTGIQESPEAVRRALKAHSFYVPDRSLSNYQFLEKQEVSLQIPQRYHCLDGMPEFDLLNNLSQNSKKKLKEQMKSQIELALYEVY
ncbi:MAG: hypothetical protein ACOYT4_05485 [Nanoarchaeota archaeon]